MKITFLKSGNYAEKNELSHAFIASFIKKSVFYHVASRSLEGIVKKIDLLSGNTGQYLVGTWLLDIFLELSGQTTDPSIIESSYDIKLHFILGCYEFKGSLKGNI